jgi:hypothetical protein
MICPEKACIGEVKGDGEFDAGRETWNIYIVKIRCFQVAYIELKIRLHDVKAGG